jgi:hypothetical protein
MAHTTHPVAWNMILNVAEFIDAIPFVNNVDYWADECFELWQGYSTVITRAEYIYGTTILLGMLGLYRQLSKKPDLAPKIVTLEEKQAILTRILSRPQVEQRTEEWYKESQRILSGSQYATLFKGGRTRGQLVLEKAGITKREPGNCTVVRTENLNPFMWGIRFEPVVKQLYEALTNTRVGELGRLRHKTNTRLGASPDGLVIEDFTESQQCLSRFVEFKAPVTREIFNKVPEDYHIQMQIQMEVGDVEECDYLEVKFVSTYKISYKAPEETPKYRGIIYIVQKGEELVRYEYSPLGDLEWHPVLKEDEEIVEEIHWHTNVWFLTTVKRSRDWYQSLGVPAEEAFWKDVEAAKTGAWTLPESSRKPREPKPKYAFVDTESEKSVKVV